MVREKGEKEGDADGETHTEGMSGEGEGSEEWDGGVSRSKGPGRQAGSVGGVRRSEGTEDAGPRAWRRRRAVGGTGTLGRERRRGQAVGGDRGRWAAGVARVETKKKKKKKGRRPKDLFGRRPEE